MENELFFVGIRDPLELRKELLTDSKAMIDALKRYERYKEIKEEKQRHILELKRVFDEMLILNKKFRGKLPKVPMKVPSVGLSVREELDDELPKQKMAPHKEERVERREPLSKLDLLEQELAKVEQRLGSLE